MNNIFYALNNSFITLESCSNMKYLMVLECEAVGLVQYMHTKKNTLNSMNLFIETIGLSWYKQVY